MANPNTLIFENSRLALINLETIGNKWYIEREGEMVDSSSKWKAAASK